MSKSIKSISTAVNDTFKEFLSGQRVSLKDEIPDSERSKPMRSSKTIKPVQNRREVPDFEQMMKIGDSILNGERNIQETNSYMNKGYGDSRQNFRPQSRSRNASKSNSRLNENSEFRNHQKQNQNQKQPPYNPSFSASKKLDLDPI